MIQVLLTAIALNFGILLSLCSGFNGPRNIIRLEGSNPDFIPCESYPLHATPFWKINNIYYYYSEVPPPFEASKSGRSITITSFDLSLNGTSFQCFIPSSTGSDLISSSIGVLTVTKTGFSSVSDVPPISKIVVIHQKLYLSPTTISLTWNLKTINNCNNYYNHTRLIVSYGCNASSLNKILITETNNNNSIIIHRADFVEGIFYFSISSFNDEGDLCEDIYLEKVGFDSETFMEDLNLCPLHLCSPTCVEVPALNGRQTLVLALPFHPVAGSEEDLLCPVHPFPGERCVDLLGCNRFRESAYANSITICWPRLTNDDLHLEMCFHNISQEMNGTRLHFFYSDLNCNPYESTRLYTKSVSLKITKIEDSIDVTIDGSNICVSSKCDQNCNNVIETFKISIVDNFSCSSQTIIYGSCVSMATLQMNTACAPYYITVEAYNMTLVFNRSITEIQGYTSEVLMLASKCTCHGSRSTRSTQPLAIGVCAIFGGIFFMLLVFIVAVAYKNYKMISK